MRRRDTVTRGITLAMAARRIGAEVVYQPPGVTEGRRGRIVGVIDNHVWIRWAQGLTTVGLHISKLDDLVFADDAATPLPLP
jgi:hypothetical protein